jgi:hypothetical protein
VAVVNGALEIADFLNESGSSVWTRAKSGERSEQLDA